MLLILLMASHELPQLGKPHPGKPERGNSLLVIAVIFVVMLIDAFLFAQVQANYIHDHGYDISLRHPAVAKLSSP